METPPPLPVAPPQTPPSFTLPLSAWIAWGIYAALSVALSSIRKAPLDAYNFGELMGGIVGMLILPTLLAMLVWRLSGRSRSAGNVTFFVVFGFSMAGQIAQFAQKAQASAAMNQLGDEQTNLRAEQRAALAQGRPIDTTKGDRLVEQASTQMGALAENSSGSERVSAEALKAFMDQMLAAKQRYNASTKQLDLGNFWNLRKFAEGAPLDERRKTVREFAQANAGLAGFQDENATLMRQIMQEHGASTNVIQDAVAGFKKGAGPRLVYMVKLRDADANYAQVMLEFIDFAESSRGKWKINESTGNIVFERGEDLARYNELIKRANAISAQEAEYQKQVFSAKD